MNNWYYSTFGAEFGPFTLEELIALAKSEQLLANDPVKLGIDGAWRKAGLVSRLIAHFPTPLAAEHSGGPGQAPSAATQLPPAKRHTSSLHSAGHPKPKPALSPQVQLKSKETGILTTVDTSRDLAAVDSNVKAQNEVRNSDDDLLRAIADTLAARNISSFARIGLDVQKGEITVRGTVASEGERLLLIHILQKTPGVVAINDGLFVSSNTGTSRAPAQISRPAAKPYAAAARPSIFANVGSFNPFESVKLTHVAYGIVGLLFIGVAGLVVQASSSKHHFAVYPADGSLSLDGAPMEGATVILNPVSGSADMKQLQIRGVVDSEGHFQLSTYGERDGAPAGDFVVTVLWCKSVTIDGETSFGPNLAPAAYSSPKTSDLKTTITKGTNHLEPIQLKGGPAASGKKS